MDVRKSLNKIKQYFSLGRLTGAYRNEKPLPHKPKQDDYSSDDIKNAHRAAGDDFDDLFKYQ